VQTLETKATPIGESSTSEDNSISAGVKLINVVRLPAYHSAAIPVRVEELEGSVLIETEGLSEMVYTLMTRLSRLTMMVKQLF